MSNDKELKPTRREGIDQYLPKRKCKSLSSKSLFQLTLDVVVEHFNEFCSKAKSIPPNLLLKILEILPDDKLEYAIGADFVGCEKFFKRASIDRFGSGKCIIECHGLSWKRLYYEMILQELLSKEKDFEVIAKAVQDYIFTLAIDRNMVGESLANIFKTLPNLTTLLLQSNAISQDNNENMFQVSQFGKALQHTVCLCSLTVSNCKFDDDNIRLLLLALDENVGYGDIRNTLTYLDVSHNRLTTDGLNLLVDFFLGPDETNDENHGDTMIPILATFSVADNNIRSEGGRSLGRMLRRNSSLTDLNLSLNRLEDEGGRLLIDGLRKNSTLQNLNLSSNSLASQSASVLTKVIEETPQGYSLIKTNENSINSLEEINLSSNNLSDNDILRLSKAVQMNNKLTSLDLRCQTITSETKQRKPTKVFESSIEAINKRLFKNEKISTGVQDQK